MAKYGDNKKECEGCGATIYGGRYCSSCKEKLKIWTTIQAMVLGCKRSEVNKKRKEFHRKKQSLA